MNYLQNAMNVALACGDFAKNQNKGLACLQGML